MPDFLLPFFIGFRLGVINLMDKDESESQSDTSSDDGKNSAGSSASNKAATSAASNGGTAHGERENNGVAQEELNRIAGKIREEERKKALAEIKAENDAEEKRRKEAADTKAREADQERLEKEGKLTELISAKNQELTILKGQLAQAQTSEQNLTHERTALVAERDELAAAVQDQIKHGLKALPSAISDLMPEGISPASQLKWLVRATKAANAASAANATNGTKAQDGSDTSGSGTQAGSSGAGEKTNKPGNGPRPTPQTPQPKDADQGRKDLVNSIVDEGRHSGRYSF